MLALFDVSLKFTRFLEETAGVPATLCSAGFS